MNKFGLTPFRAMVLVLAFAAGAAFTLPVMVIVSTRDRSSVVVFPIEDEDIRLAEKENCFTFRLTADLDKNQRFISSRSENATAAGVRVEACVSVYEFTQLNGLEILAGSIRHSIENVNLKLVVDDERREQLLTGFILNELAGKKGGVLDTMVSLRVYFIYSFEFKAPEATPTPSIIA